MINKEKESPVNSINNSKKEDNDDDESIYNSKNENKNITRNFLQHESKDKKNLTFLKEKGNSNIIISFNKKKSYLNLSDKKLRKHTLGLEDLEKNESNPINNKINNNSLEEKSSEKIIKSKIILPEKRKESEYDKYDKYDIETNVDYKLKRDLFVELGACLQKTEKEKINQKGENNEQGRSIHILRKSTGVETTKMINYNKKAKITDIYEPYINFANKKYYFIICFIIGICISIINLVLSIILDVYGNIEVYSIFILLNIFLIIVYTVGIFLFHKYNKYTFKIISLCQSPEKIEIKKNNLYLICYLLLLLFGYYFILTYGNISYKNNVKIDIKGKAYDKKKWNYSFQDKTFNEVINSFDKINIIFNIFNLLSVVLLIFILSLFIYFFNSYQFWKRINQIIILFFGQISFILINICHYCFQFRNITSLEEHKLTWVTFGLNIVGIINVIMSFFGFYVIYIENKKLLKIFNILCLIFFLGFTFFGVGAKALGLKFDDYKTAKCNNLFKFISQDYLTYNNDCTSKYLFSIDTLDNIMCPKERIMINWEITEKNDEKENIIYGCINQSCCLKIYCKLKTGFNYQEILAIYQLVLYIILFIGGIYMKYKIDKIFYEEITEKINFLIIFSLTFLIYIICFLIIALRAKGPRESILNDIKVNNNYKQFTVIDKSWFYLTDENNLKAKSDELYEQMVSNNIPHINYNIINEYNMSIFNLEYYDYYLKSQNLNIYKNSQYNNYYDFNIETFQNGTNIIRFKSKDNIINLIPKYFKFTPILPFIFKDSILLTMNAIYSIDKNQIDIIEEINSINSEIQLNNSINDIRITKDIILLNYKESLDLSTVIIINNQNFKLIDNNIDNKNNISFYLKGNVYNDNGSSLIYISNTYNKNGQKYIEKTDENGYFSIGPFYIYKNNIYPFEYQIEIYKIKNKSIGDNNNFLIETDQSYNNYITTIKIGGFGFNPYYPFPLMTNIFLTKIVNNKFEIYGHVFDNHNNHSLENVYVKLYKGNKFIESLEYLDINNYLSNSDFISQIITKKDGNYHFDLNINGQYTLIFAKEDFYIEKKSIIINDKNININDVGLIQLFNEGKIVVKLEWNNNPPDLDLICRFNVTDNKNNSKTHYCYTFFGNKKCVETTYPLDNKKGGNKGSEIIEMKTVSNYIYFFYVRKYFDISNNTAQNEYKINDIENDLQLEDIDYYKEKDDFLKNSFAQLSIYANGLTVPITIANIRNEDLEENKSNYWAGFCLNGKEGLKSLKIINEFYKNEPPKNICLHYYY